MRQLPVLCAVATSKGQGVKPSPRDVPALAEPPKSSDRQAAAGGDPSVRMPGATLQNRPSCREAERKEGKAGRREDVEERLKELQQPHHPTANNRPHRANRDKLARLANHAQPRATTRNHTDRTGILPSTACRRAVSHTCCCLREDAYAMTRTRGPEMSMLKFLVSAPAPEAPAGRPESESVSVSVLSSESLASG